MKVTVWHNKSLSFEDYEPRDELKIVFSGEIHLPVMTMDALNVIYRMFNRVDGTEEYMTPNMRSLSVGDVVEFEVDGHIFAYSCSHFGWKPIIPWIRK